MKPNTSWTSSKKTSDEQLRDLVARVRAAGVVGAGGAGFPAWRKLEGAPGADTLILNGAECEPLLHADYYCLLHYGDKVLAAADVIRGLLGIRDVAVAVKKKRRRLREHLARLAAAYPGFRMLELPDVYPSGDEHLLVQSATGRIVPQGGIPPAVGCLVQNVQSLAHIYDALDGRPVTHRFVTIAGAVARPSTFEAPIGTPLAHLLEQSGGVTCPEPRFLAGGAMMGELVELDYGIRKTTSGILVLPAQNPAVEERVQSLERAARVSMSVCDQCFACTELCPRYLLGHDIQPHLLMRRAPQVLTQPADADHIGWYCCECGVCSLIACPLRITPRRLIGAMKRKLAPSAKRGKAVYALHPDYHRKGLPIRYVMARLDLARYDTANTFCGPAAGVDHVRIDLAEFGGGSAEPAVTAGQRVLPGEIVGQGRHTPFHASIGGVVRAAGRSVEIQAG
ncbi:MAG TPA: SLBB domain-containing protein [Acidobacteriota bacterium]|nr:SLBB domain-containing protein [Acidobacteriota bacterium]